MITPGWQAEETKACAEQRPKAAKGLAALPQHLRLTPGRAGRLPAIALATAGTLPAGVENDHFRISS